MIEIFLLVLSILTVLYFCGCCLKVMDHNNCPLTKSLYGEASVKAGTVYSAGIAIAYIVTFVLVKLYS